MQLDPLNLMCTVLGWLCPDVPAIQTPKPLSLSIILEILTTRNIGVAAAPPQLLTALFRGGAALSLGMITASTPAPFAVLMQAPKL